jgi:type I restriction enzyme, S subunit
MENQNNIPKLRFPEFEGDWEVKKLGEVADISSGGTPDRAIPYFWNGNIPWVSTTLIDFNTIKETNEFVTDEGLKNSSAKLFPIGTLLMAMYGQGKTRGKIAVLGIEASTNQACGAIMVNKSVVDYLFVFQNLSKRYDEIRDLSNQGGQENLSGGIIKGIPISFPTLPEQQKIAIFLSTVDEKLQTLKKKKSLLEAYKKGVMQKIFSREICFKDDEGNDFEDWEVKKLGDCLDYIQPTKYLVESTEYDNKFSTPVLTAGKTFILGYTNETEGIFDKDLPVIIFDDFTTATQFVDFPFKAKSSAMKILVAKEDIDIKFIYEAMQIMKYEIGGHERHWISKFSLIEILFPSLPEQTKIANFLSAIDEKISKVDAQIKQTELWKKGLLQGMFV